ncbi:hypothetical protein HYH02_005006 [Chlamydomonas schloesseri]|uniref:FCP1 homology domain-containing protein n=1 Tax=Chlamydomonas schloesseri TaxID=2026947 RepID=A0A835WN18_9CHLO|nr:hypothetical protein HYH02_005006 [Chlamydomonas schloesseri]|eukprot:KAG2450505.1 hypothetical protein HYH02_005006 [Chlamydomonas schloesseri]
MSVIVDEVAAQCLLPDGPSSTLFDELPQFDDELAPGEELVDSLRAAPPAAESSDEAPGPSGNSLPATPAERPTTFSPAALPLPASSSPGRPTLVLDLDGTLISSEELNSANSAYIYNPPAGSRTPDYEAMGRRVWLRPGVKEFLVAVRPHFEIVLFTAATQNWAAAAIEQLDPSAYLFDVMLHRDHTISDLMWDYVKDLSRLGRDLSRVVIVDDNPLMFMYQPDNALHIGAYEPASAGGPDNVLERVADVLINKVAVAANVREVLGPMASAKSCITNTLTATSAPAVETASTLAGCDSAATSAADPLNADASISADAISGNATACQATASPLEWSEMSEEESSDEEAEDEALDSQRRKGTVHMDEHEEGPAFDWEDAESEGAEAYDEHGVVATHTMGVDVDSGCNHRFSSWRGQPTCAGEEGESPAADGASDDDEGQAGEEVQDEHGSEDFGALMDDAIAEYDSDAYDGEHDGELDFPAESAAVPVAVATAACGTASEARSCGHGSSGQLILHGDSAATVSCQEAADAHLPRGMVFLTDLHPALRAAGGAAAPSAAPAHAAAASRRACKRSREEVSEEVGGEEQEEPTACKARFAAVAPAGEEADAVVSASS